MPYMGNTLTDRPSPPPTRAFTYVANGFRPEPRATEPGPSQIARKLPLGWQRIAHNAALQTGRGVAPHRPGNLQRRKRSVWDTSGTSPWASSLSANSGGQQRLVPCAVSDMDDGATWAWRGPRRRQRWAAW